MTGNRRYLLRLWIPALLVATIVGALFIDALTSGDPSRSIPAAVGIVVAAGVFVTIRWSQKRKYARMLQAPNPDPFLRSLAASLGRVKHGPLFAAANSATTVQGSVDVSAPSARTSELAFRTYRNLGLALCGRATDTTAEELRTACVQLPLLGQILAAWGLAAIARSRGDAAELEARRSFIEKHAPHLKAVLASL